LARGELQLVGATTLSEYRQIEKDGALERRFQPVQVNEPSTDEALQILKGLKEPALLLRIALATFCTASF